MPASQLYEDVFNISFQAAGHSGSIGAEEYMAGCKSVSLEFGADEIEHSACDSKAVDYRGVTRKVITATIEFEGGDLAREAGPVTFGGAIGEVTSAEISETGEERMHAADGECWVSHISVSKRSIEAKVTARAIDDVDGHLEMGEVATLSISYQPGELGSGCATGLEPIVMPTMMVVNADIKATHNEYAEGTITFKGTSGVVDVDGGSSLTAAVHVGDPPGKFYFSVKNALGGAAKTYSVDNMVVISKRIALGHGEMMKETIVAKAYATDDTTPFAAA